MIHNLFDSWVDDDYQHDPEFVSKFNTLFKKNLPDLAYKLNLAGWRDLQNLDEFVLKSEKPKNQVAVCVEHCVTRQNSAPRTTYSSRNNVVVVSSRGVRRCPAPLRPVGTGSWQLPRAALVRSSDSRTLPTDPQTATNSAASS